ncbi:MAG TPA: PEGA domain-containing protein [Methanoregulaceae archaeon]|nr:PEGA domain-containing protein [Methanoregulaceae archaeon]
MNQVYPAFIRIIVFLLVLLLIPLASGQANPGVIGGDVGYFQVESNPTGAEVIFDGEFRGETPVSVPVFSTATPSHTIAISKPGYFPWIKQYSQNPAPGKTIQVYAQMEPSTSFGTLVVTSSPSGALITVDGGKGQQAPWTYTDVTAGSHIVQAFLSGYDTYAEIVNVPPGGTATVNALLVPLTNVGSLQVKTSPGGADVYINGVYRGSSDTTVGNLAAGKHFVQLKLAGYQDWTYTIEILPNQVTFLDVPLSIRTSPTTGDIQVESSPPGAAVFLDGVYQGRTQGTNPLDLTGVSPGTHPLSIQLENYQDYNTSVDVRTGQTTTVKATLVSSPSPGQSGTIQISSQPSGANVFIDNVCRGITPLTLPSLGTGTYSLAVRLAGYNDYSTTIVVNAGQALQIEAALTPVATSAGTIPLVLVLSLFIAGIWFMHRRT